MFTTGATALFCYTAFTLFFCWLAYLFVKPSPQDEEEASSNESDQRNVKNGPAPAAAVKSQAKRKQVRQRKDSHTKESTGTEFAHQYLIGNLKGHTGSVHNLSISPNNDLLASASDDRTILVWNVKDFNTRDHKQIRVNVGFDCATRVQWSPDNKAFFIGRKDEQIAEVYKVGKKPDGAVGNIQSALKLSKVHCAEIVGLGIACHGKYMMTCSSNNKLVIWDIKGNVLEEKMVGSGTTYLAKISPCARYVTSCGKHDDPNMVLYDVTISDSGQYLPMTVTFKLSGHKKGIYSFDISTFDSNRIVTLGFDGVWRLFDTSGNRVDIKRSASVHGNHSVEAPPVVAISRSGRVILVGIGQDLEIYSARSGAYLNKIESAHTDFVKDVIFSMDDKHFLSSGDRVIRVFNNIPGHEETIADLKDRIQDKSKSKALKLRLTAELETIENELKDLLAQK